MHDGVARGESTSGIRRPGVAPAEAGPVSFADFYAQAHRRMVRLAYLLTGSTEAAQDLAQDAFVRLHVAWPRVVDPAAYVRASVVNACRSYHRRRARERDARRRHVAASTELRPDELLDALGALPYRQRAALVLRFWHDLGDAEIASALRCQVGTVASLVHRGLAQLRRVIER